MNRGRLEQLAPPSQLYANPASHFVAEFVGLNNRRPGLRLSRDRSRRRRPDDRGVDRLRARAGLVRPESVTITADGPANATVASVNFLGPVSRVYVDVDDAELLMAAVPSPWPCACTPATGSPSAWTTPLLVVATPSQPSVATA